MQPRYVAVHRDGDLAFVVGPQQGLVIALADLALIATVPLQPGSSDVDAVWLGDRLLLSETSVGSTRVALVDVRGPQPRICVEKQIEGAFRLRGGGGQTALLVAASQAAVVTRVDDNLQVHPFASRAVPMSVGNGSNVAIVGTAGAIEEWDLQTRTVRRRWKLAPSALPLAVGATERVIWFTAKHDATRLEVIPLVNRGQPKLQTFGEACSQVQGSVKSDWVVALGASGQVHALDLEGRVTPSVLHEVPMATPRLIALAVGRTAQVVVIDDDGIAFLGLDASGRLIAHKTWEALEGAPQLPRTPSAPEGGVSLAMGATSEPLPATKPAVVSAAPMAAIALGPLPMPAPVAVIAPAPPSVAATPPVSVVASSPVPTAAPLQPVSGPIAAGTSLTQRLDAWRARVKIDGRNEASGPLRFAAQDNWRDAVALFAKNPDARAFERDRAVPARVTLLLTRVELGAHLAVALVNLYGSYLQGEAGVSRAALARLLDGNWNEALGQGELARHGIADFSSHLVALTAPVLRFLDEQAPQGSLARGSAEAVIGLGVGQPRAVVVDGAVWADASALAQHAAATFGGVWLAIADHAATTAMVTLAALEARLAGAGLIVAIADGEAAYAVLGFDQLVVAAVVDAAVAAAAGLALV